LPLGLSSPRAAFSSSSHPIKKVTFTFFIFVNNMKFHIGPTEASVSD